MMIFGLIFTACALIAFSLMAIFSELTKNDFDK